MSPYERRFFATTRGQVLALLRRGTRTIDDLARTLGLSDNAVRAHVAALESDGLVRRRGVRPTGGKPAFAYEIAPDAEARLSRAYIPVLTELVRVLERRLGPDELEVVLREVGRGLGASHRPTGDLRARASAAAAVLTELGGVVDVHETGGAITLRALSCPLADAVRAHPATCRAAESLVAELVGGPVRERCDRGERPRCCFELGEIIEEG